MKRGGLAIILGRGAGKRDVEPDDDADEREPSDESEANACDMALSDAYEALSDKDEAAFVSAMRDAFAAYEEE